MDRKLDRRNFARQTSAAVGGLMAGSLLGSKLVAGHEPNTMNDRLVLLGLNALARAHELNYFADAAAASRFVLLEASAAIDRFVGFGQGFAGHMLTFGQSLVELAAMGDVEWAEGLCLPTDFLVIFTISREGIGTC